MIEGIQNVGSFLGLIKSFDEGALSRRVLLFQFLFPVGEHSVVFHLVNEIPMVVPRENVKIFRPDMLLVALGSPVIEGIYKVERDDDLAQVIFEPVDASRGNDVLKFLVVTE